MSDLKLKKGVEDRVIGFGGLGKTKLKDYSQADLRKLATLGLQSGDRAIKELFEELPSVESLQKASVAEAKKAIQNPQAPENSGNK